LQHQARGVPRFANQHHEWLPSSDRSLGERGGLTE
jgi:hypothetical protein